MSRYIDADVLIDDLVHNKCFYPAIVSSAIKNTPTADAVEVVHARWNEDGRCTNCQWYMPFDSEGNAFETLYCPHCGADMTRKEHKYNEKDT